MLVDACGKTEAGELLGGDEVDTRSGIGPMNHSTTCLELTAQNKQEHKQSDSNTKVHLIANNPDLQPATYLKPNNTIQANQRREAHVPGLLKASSGERGRGSEQDQHNVQ